MLEVVLPMKARGHFQGVRSGWGIWHTSQVVPWGSYYPMTAELYSPKLCAYKSKPGPLLTGGSGQRKLSTNS